MNEQEIRAVVARFVNALRKKGFKKAGAFIVLSKDKEDNYILRLSDKKGGLFCMAYPEDLSDKSATATCELSGILYYALKNRQRTLKAAQSLSKEQRTDKCRKAVQARWEKLKTEKT